MKRFAWACLITAACALPAAGQESSPGPNKSPGTTALDRAFDDLNAQLQPLFRKYYPNAKPTNPRALCVTFEDRLTNYEFPYEGPREGKNAWSTFTGPKPGGIDCRVRLNSGRYHEQAAILTPSDLTSTLGPMIYDRKFYKDMLMAPYSKELGAHLTVWMSYAPDADRQFLSEFVAIITAFEKGAKEASGPAPDFFPVGRRFGPIDFSFRDPELDGTLDDLYAELAPLVEQYYPEATAQNLHGNGIRFEHKLMTFELPADEASAAEHYSTTREGPVAGGIQCGVYLVKGPYNGQVPVLPVRLYGDRGGPTTIDEKFYKVVLMTPYSARQNVSLFAALSYPPDADPQFIERFKAIITAFEDNGKAAASQAAESGPAGGKAD